MKIVVTGGSGFIGSYLITKLESLGYTISNIDLKVGRDIRNREDCIESFSGSSAIIHLAALVDVQESIRYPSVYNDTNINGTLKLLSLAEFYSLKKFVYISSAAAKDPSSPYGIQKLTSELYCNFFSYTLGLPTVALRLYNVYGKGNGKGVIDIWSRNIDEGVSPIVYGGEQTRDFIYIDDVVSSIVETLDSSITGVYEVGTGLSTSMTELCSLVLKLKKSSLVPVYKDKKLGEVFSSICVDKYFKTSYDLEKGFSKYLES